MKPAPYLYLLSMSISAQSIYVYIYTKEGILIWSKTFGVGHTVKRGKKTLGEVDSTSVDINAFSTFILKKKSSC